MSDNKNLRFKTKSDLVLYFLKGSKKYFLFSIIFSMLVTFFDLIGPKIIQYTVDFCIDDKESTSVPVYIRGIMDLLDQINMRGTTVLMVTHAKDIVNNMDRRIIAIDRGRVIHDSKEDYFGPMGGDEE